MNGWHRLHLYAPAIHRRNQRRHLHGGIGRVALHGRRCAQRRCMRSDLYQIAVQPVRVIVATELRSNVRRDIAGSNRCNGGRLDGRRLWLVRGHRIAMRRGCGRILDFDERRCRLYRYRLRHIVGHFTFAAIVRGQRH